MSIVPAILFSALLPVAIAIRAVHPRRRTASRAVADDEEEDVVETSALQLSQRTECVDIGLVIRGAVAAVLPAARAQWVRIELALDTTVTRIDPRVLDIAVRQVIRTAITATPGGQVLITMMTRGSQLEIGVTDDGAVADRSDREASVRGAAALIALQGGSIVVNARPGRGTAVTLRLPMPGNALAETRMADEPAVPAIQEA